MCVFTFHQGATLQQLAHSLTWLRTAVGQRDHQVMCPGESVESVRHACALLGKDLVLSETVQMEWSSGDTENNNLKIVFYRPMLRLPGVLELQYYANAVLDVFVHESIVGGWRRRCLSCTRMALARREGAAKLFLLSLVSLSICAALSSAIVAPLGCL